MSSRAERRAQRGFTLLEVMAAVLILGLSSTLVFATAIGLTRAEGQNERMLRASLWADELLTEMQGQLERGATLEPPAGALERLDMTAEIAIEPFTRAPSTPPQSSGPPPPSLFAPAAAGRGAPVVVLRVVVRWPDGGREGVVQRTSYGLDLEAAGPLLEGLANQGSEGADEATDAGAADGGPTPVGERPQ